MTDGIERDLERIDDNITGLYSMVSKLREENEILRNRISELEEVVDPDPTTDYDQLTKAQKVRKLRKALLREAMNASGKASMKYDEVRALFDMNVSPGHAYNLMEAAAKMDGFRYDKEGYQNQGQKRVAVEIDAVNDETLIQSVNNGSPSLPA